MYNTEHTMLHILMYTLLQYQNIASVFHFTLSKIIFIKFAKCRIFLSFTMLLNLVVDWCIRQYLSKYVRLFVKQKMVIQIHSEIRQHFQNIQDI